MQTDATFWPTTPNIVECMLLRVVAQSLKPVKLFSQLLPTFLLFCDRRSVAQQCWTRCTALPTLGNGNGNRRRQRQRKRQFKNEFSNFSSFIPIRLKCQKWANLPGVDFLVTALKFRKRKKNSSWLVYVLHKT